VLGLAEPLPEVSQYRPAVPVSPVYLKKEMMIESVLGVFALATIEMWAAIPLGFHLKIPPVLLASTVAIGSFLGAFAGIFAGNGIRRLIFWRKTTELESGRLSKWLVTKGPWAVGLLGPLLIGPTFAALLAGAVGMPKVFSLKILAGGILIWTTIIVILGTFGVALLN
jgi:membrane protein YqaA with SNARE-associated domain